MRGDDNLQEGMFSYISPDKRVPADHPSVSYTHLVNNLQQRTSIVCVQESLALISNHSIDPVDVQAAIFRVPLKMSCPFRKKAHFGC